jgi:hypothetical protein
VESAEALYELVAGAEVEVVGVAEDDLGANFFEDGLGDGLDGALGSDGHEDGCLYGLVGQVKAGAAGAGGVSGEEFKT